MWRRLRGEEGMTLGELLVAMSILTIVLVVFFGVLAQMQTSYGRASDRSQTVDQARLATEELDREIRSGNVLYPPSAESDPAHDIYPGMSLRIYTQTNAPTRGGPRCVQWRITSNQELQRREWAVDWHPGDLVTGWRVVAEHILNRVSPEVTAFTLDTSDLAYGNRVVSIDLVVNENGASGRTVEVKEAVTGRNTQFAYPSTACTTIPPY